MALRARAGHTTASPSSGTGGSSPALRIRRLFWYWTAPVERLSRIETDLVEMHGIRATSTALGETVLWIADNGHRFLPGRPSYVASVRPGRVLRWDCRTARCSPSSFHHRWRSTGTPLGASYAVAVDEQAKGGSGDIWVADGYGASLLHRVLRRGQRPRPSNRVRLRYAIGYDPHDVIVDRRKRRAGALCGGP